MTNTIRRVVVKNLSPSIRRPALLAATLILCLASADLRAAEQDEASNPVLLVHGMAWNVEHPKPIWGQLEDEAAGRWTGMIGTLETAGYRYGGTLRPVGARFDLPECLDVRGSKTDAGAARLFVLEFSPAANTDGLAHKGLELAEAIRRVRELAGADRVDLVAHSAGGLATRMYLEGALPGVSYRGDVDRLITIGTPHLGAAVARKMGDLLGTRATALKHDAPSIVQLNQKLDLPADVRFASIVVRGFSADVRGGGGAYDELADRQLAARLPVDYREGGDQVVHVLSQNLRLAPCAAKYEKDAGRPVLYVLARVDDPSSLPAGRRVHGAAPADDRVRRLVVQLLDDDSLWTTRSTESKAAMAEAQARLHAVGVIEAATLADHSASEVKRVDLSRFELVDQQQDIWKYAFEGKARSANRAWPLRRRWTRVVGTLELRRDAFGRVVGCTANVTECTDVKRGQ